jgi:hypothetical protein
MSQPAIDLIENGSYSKGAELMLRDIYQKQYTKLQIDYWTSEIKQEHEHAKKMDIDSGIMPKTTAERVYFAIRERMTPQTEQYRNLSG